MNMFYCAKNIFFLSAILVLLNGCSNNQNWEDNGGNSSWDQSEPDESSWGEDPGSGWGGPPVYPVFEMSKKDYIGFDKFPAKIEGIQDIEIRAKISGYIETIYVDEGQYIRKGDPLFKLEAKDLVQNTKTSETAVLSAEAEMEAFKIEVERLKPLVEKKIISEIQLQTAKANLRSSVTKYNQALSAYEGQQVNAGYALIKSPVSGYIGKLNFRIGSLVGPADVKALTTISNTKEVYAYFSMSERTFFKLSERVDGKSVAERLNSFPLLKLELAHGAEYDVEGKLDAFTGKISSSTGAIQLRAKFNNPNQELLSGSNGVIKMPRLYKNCLGIPASSSFELQGQPMVYKVIEGDSLVAQPIQILDKIDRYYLIESGLNEGDKVLAQGVSKVYPNTSIKSQLVDMDSIVHGFNPVFK